MGANERSSTLIVAIEAERVKLLEARALAHCLGEVLLYAEDDDTLMHADVAKAISMALRESVNRMEIALNRFQAGEVPHPP